MMTVICIHTRPRWSHTGGSASSTGVAEGKGRPSLFDRRRPEDSVSVPADLTTRLSAVRALRMMGD